jgi:hypothetical protein
MQLQSHDQIINANNTSIQHLLQLVQLKQLQEKKLQEQQQI